MYLRVYRVDRDKLPVGLGDKVLECTSVDDLIPGIWKKMKELTVNYIKVNDLVEALENEEDDFGIEFQRSDVIEMLPDENMLNMGSELGVDMQCNFLLKTGLGWGVVAIEEDEMFRELSIRGVYDLLA